MFDCEFTNFLRDEIQFQVANINVGLSLNIATLFC